MIKKGVGYGCCFYGTGYGNGFPDESRAKITINEDGSFTLYVACADVGQGAENAMVQICSEELSISFDNLKIINDTTYGLMDSGTAAASRQTYNTGNAVLFAAKSLKEAMNSILPNKHLFNDILEEKSFYKTVYNNMKANNIDLQYSGYFKATADSVNLETGQGNPYWPYSYEVQKAVVLVDDETGHVEVTDFTSILDCGRAINPNMVTAQMEGGVAMGIGYALMEEVIFKEGKIQNKNFDDYIIPTSLDVPHIDAVIVEKEEASGPFGAKGIGELVMIPAAAAIVNAIYDAVSVRVYELPVTCDKLLLMIKEKRKEEAMSK